MAKCDECGKEKRVTFLGRKDGKPIQWCLYCINDAPKIWWYSCDLKALDVWSCCSYGFATFKNLVWQKNKGSDYSIYFELLVIVLAADVILLFIMPPVILLAAVIFPVFPPVWFPGIIVIAKDVEAVPIPIAKTATTRPENTIANDRCFCIESDSFLIYISIIPN